MSAKFLASRRMEAIIFLLVFFLIFGSMGAVMGVPNMLNTLMKTAYSLLMETVFYIMAITVLSGAFGKLLIEFGVVRLLELLLRPLMKPLFNLPGVAALGAVMTFLSDNPAVISLSKDKNFSRYFKTFQLISFTNFASAFGMGLIVIVFMSGLGYASSGFIGLIGAFGGSLISTRLMQRFILKEHPEYDNELAVVGDEQQISFKTADENIFLRVLNSLLDGGKTGVELGLAIIPGVLIISTLVMMFTFGPANVGTDQSGQIIHAYTGAAYEGIGLLPWLAGKINFIFYWLYGFEDPQLVAFPIISLGSVGAALGLVPKFQADGLIDGNAIAVFSAMGMCWSGYLSTHTAMLDTLGFRSLTSKDIIAHTTGGLCAGIFAHWIYVGCVLVGNSMAPSTNWTTEGIVWGIEQTGVIQMDSLGYTYPGQNVSDGVSATMTSYEDGTYTIHHWYGKTDVDLTFTINDDKSLNIVNAYKTNKQGYYFVSIDEKAKDGQVSYAVLYPNDGYSLFEGDASRGNVFIYTFLYDGLGNPLGTGYYQYSWGGATLIPLNQLPQ